MGIDWEFLRGLPPDPEEWSTDEFEEAYQNLSVITTLKPRGRTVERLELLFGIAKSVMVAKYEQAKNLEFEINKVAKSAGVLDAEREKHLMDEIEHLTSIIEKQNSEANGDDISYDWSRNWMKKRTEMQEIINNKNEEINQLIENIHEVTRQRTAAEQLVQKMQAQLSSATKELNRISADYILSKEENNSLAGKLQLADNKIASLEVRCKDLLMKNDQQTEQYKAMMAEADIKIEKVKEIITKKEDDETNSKKASADNHKISQLSKEYITKHQKMALELKERNEEIDVLKKKLILASEELNENASVIKNLGKDCSYDDLKDKVSKLKLELAGMRRENGRLHEQLLAAEDDAQVHAQDLTTVLSELQAYMAGEYSLADAVMELKGTRKQLKIRDEHIKELTSAVNELQLNLNEILDENSDMREQLNLHPRTDRGNKKRQQTEQMNVKNIIRNLNEQIAKLEEDKTALKQMVYQQNRQISDLQVPQRMVSVPSKDFMPEQNIPPLTLHKEIKSLQKIVKELIVVKKKSEQDDITEKYLRLIEQNDKLQKEINNMHKKETRIPDSNIIALNVEKSLSELTPSAEENIARLNKQVAHLCEAIIKKECDLTQEEKHVQSYLKEFQSIHDEVSLMNDKYFTEKHSWEQLINEKSREINVLEAIKESLEAKIKNLESSFQNSDLEQFQKNAVEWNYEYELSKRLCEVFQKEVEMQRQKNDRITSSHFELRKKIKKVENELFKEKQRNWHREKMLKEALQTRVHMATFDDVNNQLIDMTTKYRKILNENMTQESLASDHRTLKESVKKLTEERSKLLDIIADDKQKIHSMESSLKLSSLNYSDHDDVAMKLVFLEKKELDAIQRCRHATHMYDVIKDENKILSNRLNELEISYKKAVEMNSQLSEDKAKYISLSTQLTNYNQNQLSKKIDELEKEKDELNEKNHNMKDKTVVLQTQWRHYKQRYEEMKCEADEMRERNQDLAALSDDKARIAMLHLELNHEKGKNLQLQYSLEELDLKLSESTIELNRILITMRESEDKWQCERIEKDSRLSKLISIIRDLRLQFSGAVPLPQQERYASLIDELRLTQKQMDLELETLREDKRKSRLLLEEMKTKYDIIDEKSSVPQHILELQRKFQDAKLIEVSLKERIRCLEEDCGIFSTRLHAKEKTCIELQHQIDKLENILDQEQKIWLADLIQGDVTKTADENFNLAEPVTIQPKERSSDTVDLTGQLKETLESLNHYREECAKTKKLLQIKEDSIIQLTSRLQDNNNQDRHASQIKEKFEIIVTSLKDRLQLAEDNLDHYKNTAHTAQVTTEKELEEYKDRNKKLLSENRDLNKQIRHLQEQINCIPKKQSSCQICPTHLAHIDSLETSLERYSKQLSESQNQAQDKEEKMIDLEKQLLIANREHHEDRQQTEISCEIRCQQLQREISRLTVDLKQLTKERDDAKKQALEIQETAIKSPSLILRTLVEKLRDQLIEKEKQIALLTKSVEDIKVKVWATQPESTVEINDYTPVKDVPRIFEKPVRESPKEKPLQDYNNKYQDLLKDFEKFKNEKEDDKVARESQIKDLKQNIEMLKMQKTKIEKQLTTERKNLEECKSKLELFTGKTVESMVKAITFLENKVDQMKGTEALQNQRQKSTMNDAKYLEWKQNKKMQDNYDKIKSKLSSVQTAYELSEKKVESSRETISRMERERYSLRNKISKYAKLLENPLCKVCLHALKDSGFANDQRLNATYTIIPNDAKQNDDVSSNKEISKELEDLRKQNHIAKENEIKINGRVATAMSELSALRVTNEKLNKELKAIQVKNKGPLKTGTAVVLDYESQINELEEVIREKNRLLDHIKTVLENAASNEEKLKVHRDQLLKKIALLESVSVETPHDKLILELRQAKVTINRLQRIIENKH